MSIIGQTFAFKFCFLPPNSVREGLRRVPEAQVSVYSQDFVSLGENWRDENILFGLFFFLNCLLEI